MKCSSALLQAAACHLTVSACIEAQDTLSFSIPSIDLAHETHRQIVVDREPGQYLGHPTTVLLEDGRTIITSIPRDMAGAPLS